MVYSDPQSSGADSGLKTLSQYDERASGREGPVGVTSIGERDAGAGAARRDSRPDLVQLSGNRIRVLAAARRPLSRRSTSARSATPWRWRSGDADGDGDQDLYVLRQKSRAGIKDLVLFNRGGGRAYRVVAAPSRRGGKADDVVPIDHDGNGLTDFLALNGGAAKGPVQLISFFR